MKHDAMIAPHHAPIAPEDVLKFWFDGDATRERPVWFESDPTFDAACAPFAGAVRAAREGALDHWAASPRGMLALMLLLDQLPRNLHRGSPQAFAADAQARSLARDAVARGLDRQLHPIERMFVYLPLQHSELLADQHESVRLFETMRLALGDLSAEYAYLHRDVIHRFGRFPHRNAVLGRDSTAAELAYLARPGAGF
ncbi:MAG TPA: DUF924 family protein [Acetobacteraceae bacterium]|nr:DUF924 family protein [Acetobacteraceae bacterium]